MSKSDCLSANWHKEGYEVGFDGNRQISEAFNKRAQICAKHGSQANWAEFEAGYSEGIDRYCGIPNAVKLGTRGVSRAINDNVCPESEYLGFSQAFYAGYKLFELNERTRDAGQELDRLENIEHRYRRQRQHLRNRISSGELSDDEKRHAVYRIRQIRGDIQALQYNIHACRDRLRSRQHAASKYSDYLSSEYSGDMYDRVLRD